MSGFAMATADGRTEGYVDVGGGRIWYISVGEGPAILVLHGGPGASSTYLAPFLRLASDGFRVVIYDQLGSYRSDQPDDTSLWQVARFVKEVETVRQALNLGKVRLIGQSWGAFLGLEYALHHQDQLQSLVLYGGSASTAQCVAGMNALRRALGEDAELTMAHHEAVGTTGHPDYQRYLKALYDRHLCRVIPNPPEMLETDRQMAAPVYNTMWGPNELTCTGNLRNWDRADRWGDIAVPTLILCGRYDEVVPACSETLHAGIAGSELRIFEESSHLAHFEEPEAFFATLREFLAKTESH